MTANQMDVVGDELKRRPLTQHDAGALGVTDLASRIRDLREAGRNIQTVFTVRPSRFKPRGQRVGMYVDMDRPYARRAIRAAEEALARAKQQAAGLVA